MFKRFFCWAALLASVALLSRASDSEAPLARNHASNLFRVQGIMTVGDVRFVSVTSTRGEPQMGHWLKEKDVVSGYAVEEIKRDSAVFRETSSGERFQLRLNPSGAASPGASAQAEPYSPAWINSKANPMLLHSAPIPASVGSGWLTMTAAERDEVIAYYLKHGWRLRYAESSVAGGTFVFENIYEADRRAVMDANRAEFQGMLTDDQLKAWQEIRQSHPVKIGSMPKEEVQRMVTQRRENAAAFRATLTSDQRAALDRVSDFTTGKWSNK
jgi:hypothetical protein